MARTTRDAVLVKPEDWSGVLAVRDVTGATSLASRRRAPGASVAVQKTRNDEIGHEPSGIAVPATPTSACSVPKPRELTGCWEDAHRAT